MTQDLGQFLILFAEEASCQLQALEDALHQLEDTPGQPQAVRAAFQAAHSIKGGAAMLELHGTAQLMTAFEELLGHLRGGTPGPDGWLLAAFAARDRLAWQLQALQPGEPPSAEDERVAGALRALLRPPPPAPPASPPRAAIFDVSPLSREVLCQQLRALGFEPHALARPRPPGGERLAVVSATLLDETLACGWPATHLRVVSENPHLRAAVRARGLPVSARPSHLTPTPDLPSHWTAFPDTP